MNRPTIEVDDLLDMADEALAAGDSLEAITILRKAAGVAPLRKDIRNRLALVLEGTPVQPKRSNQRHIAENYSTEFEEGNADLPVNSETSISGREAISQIARRAFEAASEKTSQAGVATRKLTDILQQGLGSWKSTKQEPVAGISSESTTKNNIFEPEVDLREYLDKNAPSFGVELDENPQDEELLDEDSSIIFKPTPVSKKSAKGTAQTKRKSRPADVEDVLAAGIGGFIEAAARVDRRRLSFGLVYVFMTALFGYACFDVSKKFSSVTQDTSKTTVMRASIGMPNSVITESGTTDPFAVARRLADKGDYSEAVGVLKSQLESGSVLSNREAIRVELATVLNQKAEKHLQANEFVQSVTDYKEALTFLPNDIKLKVRLANALYYQATLGTGTKAENQKLLQTAERTILAVTEIDSFNLQAFRLLALVYDASGKKDSADSAWKKVKALAPEDSAVLSEAGAHLK